MCAESQEKTHGKVLNLPTVKNNSRQNSCLSSVFLFIEHFLDALRPQQTFSFPAQLSANPGALSKHVFPVVITI
jgi:hypothetical protein